MNGFSGAARQSKSSEAAGCFPRVFPAFPELEASFPTCHRAARIWDGKSFRKLRSQTSAVNAKPQRLLWPWHEASLPLFCLISRAQRNGQLERESQPRATRGSSACLQIGVGGPLLCCPLSPVQARQGVRANAAAQPEQQPGRSKRKRRACV